MRFWILLIRCSKCALSCCMLLGSRNTLPCPPALLAALAVRELGWEDLLPRPRDGSAWCDLCAAANCDSWRNNCSSAVVRPRAVSGIEECMDMDTDGLRQQDRQ